MKMSTQEDKIVATRLIWNPEYPFSMIANFFCNNFAYCFNNDPGFTKFLLKKKLDLEKTEKLMRLRDNYDYFVDADWSQFDGNIAVEILKIAMSILFSEYASIDKESMRVSFFMISSVVEKFLIINPGIVCKIFKGNPSGHPMVTLVNCFSNLIYWSLIGFKIYGKDFGDFMDITVYGDDAMVFFKKHENLAEIDNIIKEIGLKSDPICPKLYDCRNYFNVHDEPDFLKRKFNRYQLVWSTEKVFDKLVYPDKNRTLDEQIETAVNYVETAPFDEEFNEVIESYINWAHDKFYKVMSEETVFRIKNFRSLIATRKKQYLLGNSIITDDGFYLEKKQLSQGVFEKKKGGSYKNFNERDLALTAFGVSQRFFINDGFSNLPNTVLEQYKSLKAVDCDCEPVNFVFEANRDLARLFKKKNVKFEKFLSNIYYYNSVFNVKT